MTPQQISATAVRLCSNGWDMIESRREAFCSPEICHSSTSVHSTQFGRSLAISHWLGSPRSRRRTAAPSIVVLLASVTGACVVGRAAPLATPFEVSDDGCTEAIVDSLPYSIVRERELLALPNGVSWSFDVPLRVYPSGAPLPLRFVLRNSTPVSQLVRLAGSHPPVLGDVTAWDSTGRQVWTLIGPAPISLTVTGAFIEPGDSLLVTHYWDQRDFTGHLVPSGWYLVRGYLHPKFSRVMPCLYSDVVIRIGNVD